MILKKTLTLKNNKIINVDLKKYIIKNTKTR